MTPDMIRYKPSWMTAAFLASIPATGFLVAVASATLVDARVAFVDNPIRIYPLGYWAAGIGALIIQSLTMFAMRTLGHPIAAATAPLILVTIGALALAFHTIDAGVIIDCAVFGTLAVTATVVDGGARSSEYELRALQTKQLVPIAFKVAHLEESARDLRHLLLALLTASVGLVFTWSELVWKIAEHIVRPEDIAGAALWGELMALKITLVSMLIVLGPLGALYRGLRRQRQLLIDARLRSFAP